MVKLRPVRKQNKHFLLVHFFSAMGVEDQNSVPWNSRVEVLERISSEQRLFRFLAFLSADSEKIENISDNQWCFRADQFWFSLNQGCSELKKSALFQRESALNQRYSALFFLPLKHRVVSVDSAFIYSDLVLLLKHADTNIKLWYPSQKWWKRLKWSLKRHSSYSINVKSPNIL